MNKSVILSWKRRFNKSALNHNDDADIGIWSHHGFERRFNTFFSIFKKDYFIGKMILDIGCGSGAYTRKLSKMGFNVVGIDYAEHVIKKAVEKSNGEEIPYIIGALPTLPLKDGIFDIAIFIGVLQSMEDRSSAIDDIGRVLNDKGIIILMTLNSISIRMIYKKIIFNFRQKIIDEEMANDKLDNPFKLKEILKNKGFCNVRIIPLYIFPKILIPLESLFEKIYIFKIIDKIPIISLLLAHAFIIEAGKVNEK